MAGKEVFIFISRQLKTQEGLPSCYIVLSFLCLIIWYKLWKLQASKQASLTVNSHLAFNSTICTQTLSTSLYQSKRQEPTLPVYVAQMVNAKAQI